MPNSTARPSHAPDPLQRIKHVVVVMLENRSFDNLLGWLYDGAQPPRGQQFEGLNRSLWNPLDNIDSDGIPFVEKVFVRKNGEPLPYGRHPKPLPPDFCLPTPDPGEGFRCTNHQLFGYYQAALLYPPAPTNMGFVNDYRDTNLFNTYSFGEAPSDPREIMICYTPDQVPVLSTLARQFAVCDHWYASVPSETLPNRHFTHAATSGGQVNNAPKGDCDARTIYNLIQDAIEKEGRSDLSWRVYCGTSQGRPFSLTRLVLTQLHDPKLDPNFPTTEQFYADAAAGKLPSYAFVEPQFHYPGANDQHPPQDIRPGERFIADVYHALTKSPQWHETLLVITYDEHGGCYDHVGPPGHATPPDRSRPPGQDGFLFNRFGLRVPTVLVSPWVEAGTICRPSGSTPFDHTSIIATVRRCCGLSQALTARDEAAPELGCVLTLKTPRTDKPAVHPLPVEAAAHEEHVNDLHRRVAEILEQRTGRRRTEEKNIFDFIHRAYHQLFPNQPRK
jgi:phospholipase C